jgi:hypothetical protein
MQRRPASASESTERELMPRSLTERVLALVDRADALARLRFLQDFHEATASIRSEALAELLDADWTRYAIAQELGISHQAVAKWR